MKNWTEVKAIIDRDRLPLQVFWFNGNAGRMIDLPTGQTLADTVKDAECWLRGTA